MLSTSVLDLLTVASIDVSAPGRTRGQFVIGVLVTAALVISLIVAYRRTRYAGLPDQQRDHKATLLGNLRDQTPETVYIGPSQTVADRRDRITDAFNRVEFRVIGEETGSDHDPGRVTVREGVAVVGKTLRKEALDRLPTVPQFALRLASLAVSVLVLGFLAVSSELLIRALLLDAGAPSSRETVADAIWLTEQFAAGAIEFFSLFPGAELLFSLLLSGFLILGPVVFEHYYIVAAALAAFAVLIGGLDRLVPDHMDRAAFRHDRSLSWQSFGMLAGLWAVGVLPSAAGHVIGERSTGGYSVDFATVGTAIGALAVLTVLAILAYRAAMAIGDRVSLVIDLAGEGAPVVVVSYLFVRYLAVGLALIAAPLVPIFAGVILYDGVLLNIAGALVAADPLIQLLVLLGLVGVWLGLGRLVPDAQRDLRTALSETTARSAVRVAVFQRGFVLAVFLIGGSVLYAVFRSLLIAGAGGAALAGVAWVGLTLVDRATFRARLLDGERVSKGVLLKCYWIRDADEQRHRVAVVERGRQQYRLASDDREQLLADIELVAERLQAAEDVPMTLSGRGGQDRLEDGLVDGESPDRLREEIRKTIRGAFGTNRRATVSELRAACDEYHEPLWQQTVETYLSMGVVSVRQISGGELWADDEATLTLDRDLWRSQAQRPDSAVWTGAA